ncbi:hypothetical protein HMPREF9123_2407 [Neisseria bacilliformis ATCC BAA-1200]|uniref:Uncharacterized protein n=1 Tax=Neisseria bacilliformis ATCC BAA-1200 TaxID=888742 RepID=F2BFA0_9NEIS|nr:hypothetical protein HMPREF9123_2407 [Neisseria bacilliformis ATCC BAA-1200]
MRQTNDSAGKREKLFFPPPVLFLGRVDIQRFGGFYALKRHLPR